MCVWTNMLIKTVIIGDLQVIFFCKCFELHLAAQDLFYMRVCCRSCLKNHCGSAHCHDGSSALL